MANVRVVIPSLLGDTAHLALLCDTADRAGASPVVVANSAHLREQLEAASVPYVTSMRNGGFAASVLLGAQCDWDWLVILNDDVKFDPDDLAACLSPVKLNQYGRTVIIHFDNEPPRRIPGRFGVLASTALVSNIIRRIAPRSSSDSQPPNAYRSFSAVAISREVWEQVGGLDERYPFAYEDADFVRQALGLGVKVAVIESSVRHLHSQTGGKFLPVVLPVASWSALEYLTKWYGHRTLNKALLLMALAIRVPIAILFTKTRRKQLAAVRNTVRALVRDAEPALPSWSSNYANLD